jgi:hypothetical protein
VHHCRFSVGFSFSRIKVSEVLATQPQLNLGGWEAELSQVPGASYRQAERSPLSNPSLKM